VVLRPRSRGDTLSVQGDFTDVTTMALNRSLIDARREQMFPILERSEIDRVRRFGERRSYPAGEALVKVGEVGHGLIVVLAGGVAVSRRDELGRRDAIVTHGQAASSVNCHSCPDAQRSWTRTPRERSMH
jgi:hypothetical protein